MLGGVSTPAKCFASINADHLVHAPGNCVCKAAVNHTPPSSSSLPPSPSASSSSSSSSSSRISGTQRAKYTSRPAAPSRCACSNTTPAQTPHLLERHTYSSATPARAPHLLQRRTCSNAGSRSRTATFLRRSGRACAAASVSVTFDCPPTRLRRSPSLTISGSVQPCTVAMMRTPRCAMLRTASTSSCVEISSQMMMSGVWFSTASRRICACLPGTPTGIQRADPIAAWGLSPSPAISHVLSTTTTVSREFADSVHASSRSSVVFPTPGRPISSSDFAPT
eukprot:364683-Chlamydomonas_euryale.AAC.1